MGHHDRVAVGRRLGGHAHADDTGNAAPVIDDHLLAEAGAELFRHDAGHRIDAASGGNGTINVTGRDG